MSPIFYPLHIFSILFFFFTRVIPSSTVNNVNINYTICSNTPFSCGNVTNVMYPFSGVNRPQFCGHPNFRLACRNGRTFIDGMGRLVNTDGTSSDLSSHVVDIKASSHTMSLVETTLDQDNASCPYPIKNQTGIYLQKPLKFSPIVTNLSVFFDCNGTIVGKYTGDKFSTCYNDLNGTYDPIYYSDNQAEVGSISKSCRTTRLVPVLKSDLDELVKTNGSLLRVLQKGFEVEYMVDFKGCLACQNSGGSCGSSDDSLSGFACYCPDGVQPLVCRRSANARRRKSILIVSGSLALGILVLAALIICTKKRLLVNKFPILDIRRKRENENVEAFLKSYGSLAPKRYRYADIKKITNSFKEKLGEGGFGSVYKGKLQDGRLVAVKLLNKMKGNGEDIINEVLSISRTNHVNVVTLLGFCLEGNKRALIYEYLVNGSLDKYIYGSQNGRSLRWETLFKIAVGIARGLDYLHRGCNTRILHFDIKPHNVLLDEDFCPKISDFGLAKLCPGMDSTVSMLEARGTIGYIAPEVFCRNFGGVSHKSDVYSYGMMVLDMACGRQNLSAEVVQHSSGLYFPDWIYNRLEHKEHEFDATLNEEERKVQRKMILVSLWCIQTYPTNRPSMNIVLEMIEGPLESLTMPPRAQLSIIDSPMDVLSTI